MRYYTLTGRNTNDSCTFAAGQKADVAVSDVFYECCASLPSRSQRTWSTFLAPCSLRSSSCRPRTASPSTLTYKRSSSHLRLRRLRRAHGRRRLSDPAAVFCRDPSFGHQIASPRTLASRRPWSRKLRRRRGTGAVVISVLHDHHQRGGGLHRGGQHGLCQRWPHRPRFPVAGTDPGLSSTPTAVADRRNVRDGHYTIWGYEHLIAKTAGGTSLGGPAGELAAWVNGTKTSTNLDYLLVETGAGLVPQCAMKVKRSADGGTLSPLAPSAPCHCAFEAIASQSIPAGCVACTTSNQCAGGKNCRRGFCE